MSVQSQIDRLNTIKQRIRTNLVAQGITVPADTTLDEMATLILSVAGEDGSNGADGVSPTVTVNKSGKVTTITITDKNGAKTAAINDGEDGKNADTIPDYVANEAERLSSVVQNHQNADTFSFLAVSDFHHTNSEKVTAVNLQQMNETLKHCGQGMSLVRKKLHIDFAIMLGDIIWDYGETPAEAMSATREVNFAVHDAIRGLPNFRVKGNHDMLSQGTDQLTNAQVFANIGSFNSGAVFPSTNKVHGYCYRDFEDYKVRVVLINTSETADSNVEPSAEQLTWLESALTVDTAEGWGTIILSHIPLDRWGNDSATMQVVKAAIGVICCIHGHTHNYKVDNLGDTDIKRIAIPNACFYRSNEVGENEVTETPDGVEWGEDTTYNKVANTAEDTAFCIITIDRTSGKLYADHYGAGYDREVDIPSLPVEITNLVPTSIDLDGEGIWNDVGYKDDTYLTTSSPYYSDCTQGATMTGLLLYSASSDKLPTIYMKGVDFSTTYSHNRIGFFDSTLVCKETYKPSDTTFATFFTLTELGNKYYKLEPKYTDGYNAFEYTGKTWCEYISISAVGSGADMIVTFDEPIE